MNKNIKTTNIIRSISNQSLSKALMAVALISITFGADFAFAVVADEASSAEISSTVTAAPTLVHHEWAVKYALGSAAVREHSYSYTYYVQRNNHKGNVSKGRGFIVGPRIEFGSLTSKIDGLQKDAHRAALSLAFANSLPSAFSLAVAFGSEVLLGSSKYSSKKHVFGSILSARIDFPKIYENSPTNANFFAEYTSRTATLMADKLDQPRALSDTGVFQLGIKLIR